MEAVAVKDEDSPNGAVLVQTKRRAPAAMRQFICVYCGAPGEARKSNARFHDDCRIRAWRQAKRKKQPILKQRALRRSAPKAPIAKPVKTFDNGGSDQRFSKPKSQVPDFPWEPCPDPDCRVCREPWRLREFHCDCRICRYNHRPGSVSR